jgi:flagellar biosynthetic protein FliR
MTMDLTKAIAGAMLIAVRISGLLLFAPFVGSSAVPARVKAALVFALTALLFPAYGSITLQPSLGWGWIASVGSELFVGVALGLMIGFVFEGAQLAGQVLGVQMGFSLANVLDPQSQVESSVMSAFHQTIALLIFLQLDVHHWLFRGIAKSFQYVPLGKLPAGLSGAGEVLKAASGLWLIGIQIAAPALIATMLADIGFAFLAKASPQFPVLLVGLSIKSVAGFLLIAAALRFWPPLFERYFSSALSVGERILQLGA